MSGHQRDYIRYVRSRLDCRRPGRPVSYVQFRVMREEAQAAAAVCDYERLAAISDLLEGLWRQQG